MDIKSLQIKTKTNYNWDDISYTDITVNANIYYIGYVLYPDYDYNTINPLYFVLIV